MRDATLGKPHRSGFPLVDRLGELCISGRDSAAYLWQVPADDASDFGDRLATIFG